ncbi:hypothetical protein L596_022718 [Steinernema carpocapsae]|uniref:Uncharacterized protein n=1 Tax=Steinernema carpocapsae TaxID=34508 RepID=A0A4U5MMY2_STECR|nr:hypothetical protein L596_022718 [Steinernema carpocapsae]
MNFVPFHFINDVTDHLPYFDLNKILLIGSSWSANYCHKTRRDKTPLELHLLVHPTGLSCSLYALTNKGQYERFVDVTFLQNDFQEMVFLTICATAETGVTRLITDMDYQILLDFLKLQKTPLQKI